MSKWIKTSEELPQISNHNGFDCSDVVLCYGLEDYYEEKNIYFLAYRVGGNRFYNENGECFKVTHWQPLPEPPKEF